MKRTLYEQRNEHTDEQKNDYESNGRLKMNDEKKGKKNCVRDDKRKEN